MNAIDFRLDGQRALVTGAGRGIGAAVARALANDGASVVVSDIAAEPASDVAEQLPGARGVAIPADVGAPKDVSRLFEKVTEALGGLDVLVCCAGVTLPRTITDTSLDDWNAVLRTNLTGSFLCAQQAVDVMLDQETGGRIIFIGSIVGHRGALKGHVAYAASKSGVHGLAKTLARTTAPAGITVNVVAPGPIETDMLRGAHPPEELAEIAADIPLGLGAVEDVAATVVFLASKAGRHITGATIDVNGGQLMR